MTEDGDLHNTHQRQEPVQSAVTNGEEHPPLQAICTELHRRVESFLHEDFSAKQNAKKRSAQQQCRHSLGIIQEALDRYPLHTLAISYNGGKDCLVLLLLYLSLLSTHPDLPSTLSAIYIPPRHPFPAMDDFVASSSSHYRLALTRQTSPSHSMKDAFAAYLHDSPAGRSIQAIFVGTRRSDPHSEHLTAFDMTDRGWPSFMRVHPVLEWHYPDVWAFLRSMQVDWCQLYDQGFTSLGGIENTHPNPKLRYLDPDTGQEKYQPGWDLEDDDEERLGRD